MQAGWEQLTFSATVSTSVPGLVPGTDDAVMIFTLAGMLHKDTRHDLDKRQPHQKLIIMGMGAQHLQCLQA